MTKSVPSSRGKKLGLWRGCLCWNSPIIGQPEGGGKSEGLGEEAYSQGRNFGHLAFQTDDIYGRCQHLIDMGYVINRPPRDGRMAFVCSPDGISVELLQKGKPLPLTAPWQDMKNIGCVVVIICAS